MSTPVYTYKTAIEQLKKCGFECEGGPLENNAAFQFLTLGAVPEYRIGQTVFVQFEYESPITKKTVKQWERVGIVGCIRESSDTDVYYDYFVSNDPCQPYHYGGQVIKVKAKNIRLEKPNDQ
jgi:hypothetical protein